MDGVDTTGFLVIVTASAVAAGIAAVVARRFVVPVVVIELALGIVIGPEVLGLVEPDDFIGFFSSLGLGMLFFFAGYEIDFRRIRGEPLRLAAIGWVASLAIAYGASGVLEALGIVLSWLFVGTAMATTAIGTLIPIVGDSGDLKSRFGTLLLGTGAIGEFGPILLITLLFSTRSPASAAAILVAFVVLAVVAGLFAVRSVGRTWNVMEQTLESSSQLAVRSAVVMVFALTALAASLGLDLLLGGFVAGIILRLALQGREVQVFESKITAVGYGFLIPFFFVVSGVNLQVSVLIEEPTELLKVPLFLVLFFVVRGVPLLWFHRAALRERRDRLALAFFTSTQLPLVVAITTIAIDEGHMRATTAASLVTAAILSTAIYPLVGLHLRARSRAAESAADAEPLAAG